MGRPFGALRSGDFRLLWLGSAALDLAQAMSGAVVVFLLWDLTHDPFAGLFNRWDPPRVVLGLAFALAAGVLADRVDRRRLLVRLEALFVLGLFVLALLILSRQVEVWHGFLLVIWIGLLSLFRYPARFALLPHLVRRGEMTTAVGLFALLPTAAGLVGAIVTQEIVRGSGTATACVVCSVLGSVGLATILFVKSTNPVQERARSHGLGSLVDVLKYVVSTPLVGAILLLDLVLGCVAGWLALAIPTFWVRFPEGVAGFAILAGATSYGSVVGLVVVVAHGDIRAKGQVLVGMLIALGMAIVIVGYVPWFLGAVGALFVAGATLALVTMLGTILLVLRTPSPMLGRVMSLDHILRLAGAAPVLAVFPAMLGQPLTMTIAGGAAVAFALILASGVSAVWDFTGSDDPDQGEPGVTEQESQSLPAR